MGAEEKETAQAKKSYEVILKQEIAQGLTEIQRPSSGLFFSGLSAGLDVGFSVFLMAVVSTGLKELIAEPILQLILGSMYSVGFIFVILGRSELFTEHTTLAVLPFLRGEAPFSSLIRLWIIVYFSNLLGAGLFSLLLVLTGPSLGVIDPESLRDAARSLVEHPFQVIFLSGLMAGWLMGLLSWLVTAGKETIAQIFLVWLVTSSIGIGKLHHCIVGSIEILPAVYLNLDFVLWDFVRTIFWTTLGNIAGGVVFVAVLKYTHAVRTGKSD